MRANTGLLAIIGKKGRNPGHIASAGKGASLKVHIGARLRNALDDYNAVPGYTLMAPVTGRPYWLRRHRTQPQWSWAHRGSSERDVAAAAAVASSGGGLPKSGSRSRDSSTGPKAAERIEEAEVGALEAELLGLPHEVSWTVICESHDL
ncbi:hypothetical protein PG993_011148 [Apiospora rasikravindrae]|uniref:Uncharacterized protein n=1 Tax=Apiospora rasikravindrae TaxID=990691 RepID=A0ABR1SDF0_9PEZI